MTDPRPLPSPLACPADARVAAEWTPVPACGWKIPALNATASLRDNVREDTLHVPLRDESIEMPVPASDLCLRLAAAARPEPHRLLRHLALLAEAHPAANPLARVQTPDAWTA
jgi:hypothetical protein